MCYSAEIEEDYRKFLRVTGADMSIQDFARIYHHRKNYPKVKLPRALDRWFESITLDGVGEIRGLIAEHNALLMAKEEEELFTQRTRLVKAERALATKPTKKAAEDQRIAGKKMKAAKRRMDAMKRTTYEISDGRYYSEWFAPVVVVENGKRICKPMRWKLRPAGMPASFDKTHPGAYNARQDNLDHFWKRQFSRQRCATVARRFFESVEGPDGESVELEFQPNGLDDMLVACIWDRWTGNEGETLESFAAVTTDPPPEVRAAGHDRCIIPLKPEHLTAWLDPSTSSLDAVHAILEDRERPYYEHRLAA